MKKRSPAKYFLQKDAVHNRIDLHRAVAHLLSSIAVVWWAVAGASDGRDFLQRCAVAGGLVIAGRLILGRLGTSRLADVGITSVLLVLVAPLSLSEIMLINVFTVCALLLQEYLISPQKHVAVGTAVLVGAIIGLASGLREILMTFVVIVLVARIASYVVQRQLSKKAFVLFGFKAVYMILIIWGISATIQHFYSPSFVLPSSLSALHIPLWLIIIFAVFAVRGLWVTMLLKTKRSPNQRSLRLFYVGLAAVLLGVVALISEYGDQIFLPHILAKFTLFGLGDPSLIASTCYVLAVSLLVGAGIDRSLLLSNRRTRSVATRLGLSTTLPKVSHKE